MKPSLFLGGKYPNSPLRHRNVNTQTLKDLAESLGYTCTNDPINADIYLSIDYNGDNEEILRERKRQQKLNILLRNEPRCVLPAGYSRTALELNDHIMTFGVAPNSQNGEFWPQFWTEDLSTESNPQRIQDRAVLVNANKLNLSDNELYSLRRKCIKELPGLDLYGADWNISLGARIKVVAIEILKAPIRHFFTFPFHSRFWFNRWSVTHAPINKNEVLMRYKVSLVIENEITYLSEKLFDALASGCIPVYVGPNIDEYGIPKGLVYQSEPKLGPIKDQLKLAFDADYDQFQEKLSRWLKSPETREQHFGENVMARVLENCAEKYMRLSK